MQQKHAIVGTLALGLLAGAASAQEAAVIAPATQQAAPGGMMDRAVDVRAPVYVDDSFASLEKIRTAARYERQNQSRLAIETYQQTVDEFGQKLIFLSDNRYVSLAAFVRAKLLGMPAVQQGEYDHIYGPAAQSAIAEALDQNDEAKLRAACDRYFPATAAVAGVDQAARISFERGAFATAARLWESLLDHPAAKDQKAAFVHHAAVALHLSGQDERAHALRDQLAREFPDARDQLGSEEQNLLAELDRQLLSQSLNAAIASNAEWPMFMGNPARNAISDAHAQAGARLWSYRYRPQLNPSDESATTGEEGNIVAMRAAMMRSNGDDTPGFRGRLTFPVVSDGRIFIHSGSSITALSLSSSQELWEYPKDADRQPASPAAAARAMAMMASSTFNHDSCSVSGDVVYASLIGDVMTNMRRRGIGGNSQFGRVVAVNAKTGDEIWSTAAGGLLPNTQVALIGAPLATPQGVYVMGRKISADAFSQLYLFRLSARTGDVEWSTYICSASSSGGYIPYGLSLPPAMMALADDVLYVSSGQNAVCAIDASLGRIIWLNITEPSAPADIGAVRAMTDSWRVNAPLVWGDRVIASEPGSPIRIYERATGRQVGQSLTTRDYGDLIAGISGQTLITIGSQICFYNLATGRDAQPPLALPQEGNRVAGRPFLTRDQVYVPMEKGLAIVPLSKDGALAFTAWPNADDDRPGEPGNLLVTDQQIIVADHDEISWYSRWETARDYRLEVIRKNPADPGAHLDLAEIAFRTQHFDLAREYTAKAVELAAAKADDTGDVLSRMYDSCLAMADQSTRATPARLDQARFYYEQCKIAARGPVANAQWRIKLAQLAQSQEKFEEAVTLYSQILADSALRAAAYQSQSQATRAGVVAETSLRSLINTHGRQIYLRFEEQAAIALRQARQAADAASLQNLMDAFPNSQAATAAAGDLAEFYQKRGDAKSRINTLHWLYAHTQEADRAGLIAQIASTQADLHRWGAAVSWALRGERRFPEYRIAQNGSSLSFHELADVFRKTSPLQDRVHRAQFALPMSEADISKPIASGTLLAPVDSSPELQSPDYLLYLDLTARSSKLHIRPASAPGSEGLTCELPESGPATLLGVTHDLAILAGRQNLLAVNLKSGVIEWKIGSGGLQALVAPDRRAGRIGGGMRQPDDVVMAIAESASYDPDFLYMAELRRSNGNLPFTAARILGDKLVIVGSIDGRVVCYNVNNGSRLWAYDAGAPSQSLPVVLGNDQFIVLQGETADRASSSFTVLTADQGKLHGTLKMPGRAIWRALSDDNLFFAASGSGMVAFNLQGNLSTPIWRRDDIKMRQGTAAALTLDGVVVVSKGDELYCLTTDGGESRWPDGLRRLRTSVALTPGAGPAVRVMNDGDLVLVQTASPAGLSAYRTDTGAMAWEAALGNFDAQSVPAFRSMPAMGERYIAQLAQSEIAGRWATGIYILDRQADGKLVRNVPLYRSPRDHEGPRISRWSMTNAGVAFESFGMIYLYGASGQP